MFCWSLFNYFFFDLCQFLLCANFGLIFFFQFIEVLLLKSFFFLMLVFILMNFSFRAVCESSHRFWYAVFPFYFVSIYLLFPFKFLLDLLAGQECVVYFHSFMNFPVSSCCWFWVSYYCDKKRYFICFQCS